MELSSLGLAIFFYWFVSLVCVIWWGLFFSLFFFFLCTNDWFHNSFLYVFWWLWCWCWWICNSFLSLYFLVKWEFGIFSRPQGCGHRVPFSRLCSGTLKYCLKMKHEDWSETSFWSESSGNTWTCFSVFIILTGCAFLTRWKLLYFSQRGRWPLRLVIWLP